jgi:hypothetical protein
MGLLECAGHVPGMNLNFISRGTDLSD